MEPEARANQLYWESSRSVNQIADELELSKGMLYGMIRPLPAEQPCPRCAAPLQYANRTARERGLLTCRACGLEVDGARPATIPEPAPAPARLDEPPVAEPRYRGRRHDPVMLGAGLLLIAAGIWIFRGIKRR